MEPQTAPQQGPIISAISLSKTNVIDFIRAKGTRVPIIISPTSVKAYIEAFAASWAINFTKMPRNLVTNCVRVGSVKAAEAIMAMIPADLKAEAKLPRYLADRCLQAGAEAAEKAIGPWVLEGMKHVSSNRQAAGVKTQMAVQSRKIAFDTWKETAGVKIIPPADGRTTFICADSGVVLETSVQLKAALAQNLVAEGGSELEACKVYADANGIGWPDSLNTDE
jgi:hypothetical protein